MNSSRRADEITNLGKDLTQKLVLNKEADEAAVVVNQGKGNKKNKKNKNKKGGQ